MQGPHKGISQLQLLYYFHKTALLTRLLSSFYIEISDTLVICRSDTTTGGGMPTLADNNLSIDVVAKGATSLFGPLVNGDYIL